ncbi:ATP synthase F1 subcomplex delta subunit [Tranquillimonas alkanivorans]|uniref:ATP synthase subunit delta n=2 Tax=Tranquillimonas alkanivorans TaxID=441119 RepID=A0A1I5NBU4_9RHOB|nr:ATP synthase F1 subcomplex delta subunit [Tranquillimonas alkanivorans]
MAIFELAKEDNSLQAVDSDVETLDAALKESTDFRALIHSPIYSREQQQAAVAALAEKMGLTATVGNTLRLMAAKRRLFVLPQLVVALRERLAEERGEVTAEVTTAKALTEGQRTKLAETLKASVGREIKLNTTVDESLIGGLIVKVGSRMIDTSIRSKLDTLQHSMKEVG